MISANSVVGLTEIGAVGVSNDQSEMGDINANVRAEVAVNPESELIPVARGNGVLYACSGSSLRTVDPVTGDVVEIANTLPWLCNGLAAPFGPVACIPQ